MAWYLRKSVSLGPVRFNLSKSGIGTSVGVTGFRVGIRPNGSSYVHAGRHGIYYREELGKGKKRTIEGINEKEFYSLQSPTEIFESTSSQKLISSSRKELLAKLNKSYKSIRLDYICAVLFFIGSLYLYSVNHVYGVVLAVVGLTATIFTILWESKRRTVEINYEFDSNDSRKYEKKIQAFNSLASNNKIWAMIDSRNIYSHESKLNAGAGSLINRTNAKLGEGKPPWVKTNINVPTINAKGITLYLMPDGMLVYDNKGVGFVEYDELEFDYDTSNFIENERVPRDSEVLYQT